MQQFAAIDLHISIASEALFTIGGFAVTNALVTGLIGSTAMLAILVYVARSIKNGRYNRFVGLVQWVFEGLLAQINDIIPDPKLARKITPLAITIFFFVLLNYWLSILPGLDSITVNHIPVIRSMAADLNFTLGMALIVFVTVQVYAIRTHGALGNAGRYLRNPFKDPIGSFEGILELIGEVSRYSALALRLFGNCFAGEVLLIVIGVLASYFAAVALPFFMIFELFIGFIQAYVFFVLTLIFTALAQDVHTADHSPADHPKTATQLE